MRVSDFHFHLPPELIARHPPAERDGARMLTVNRITGRTEDHFFRDLPPLLRPGDLVVFNDSRVIPARLFGRRAGLHTQANSPAPAGLVEVLLTQQLNTTDWRSLVKPARKVQPGENLVFGEGDDQMSAEVVGAGDRGERTLRFAPTPDFFARLDVLGHIPLPPYLHRADTPEDRARYQTIYADPSKPGSAAAPTAGLHFTPDVLNELQRKGVETAQITLHVGLGTFQPVHVEQVEDIRLHAEHYTLPAATADAINRARREHRRIIAVGTTTVRTLEHCAREAIAIAQPDSQLAMPPSRLATGGWQLVPHSGSTSIFLKPGDAFHLVDALLTNFHLPESTLLMLVGAFVAQRSSPAQGIAHVLAAYRYAVAQHYRFFSYGDCMFLSEAS